MRAARRARAGIENATVIWTAVVRAVESGTAVRASATMGRDAQLPAAHRPVAMKSSLPVCPLGFRRLRRQRIHQRRIQAIVGLEPFGAQRVAHVRHQ